MMPHPMACRGGIIGGVIGSKARCMGLASPLLLMGLALLHHCAMYMASDNFNTSLQEFIIIATTGTAT
jgi:hypothetical protein